MQKIFKNAEKFQLGIWFVLILMLDVSAEHTEENHATFRKFRDFVWLSRARTSESKQNKRKIFWNFLEFLQFLWKIVLLTDNLLNFVNRNQRSKSLLFSLSYDLSSLEEASTRGSSYIAYNNLQ